MIAEDDRGPWFKPEEAVPRLGLKLREVRQLCQSEEIDHRRITRGERTRYLISDQAITRYLRRTTFRAKSSP